MAMKAIARCPHCGVTEEIIMERFEGREVIRCPQCDEYYVAFYATHVTTNTYKLDSKGSFDREVSELK